MKQVTAVLEDDLHKKVKIKLAEKEQTFRDYFVQLIKNDLCKEKEQTR